MILRIFISAFLFYFSFPNILSLTGFFPLAFVFAIPLFFALEDQDLKKRLLVVFLFGFLTNLLSLNWMIPYSWPGYLFLSLVLSFSTVIFAGFYRPGNGFYVAALWVVTEFLRKIFMMGQSWDLAHTQTFNIYFLQLAGVLGSAGISFVLILVNYYFYRFLKSKKEIAASAFGLLAMTVLLGGIYLYGWVVIKSSVLEKEVIKICALQAKVDYKGELTDARVTNIVETHLNLTKEALKNRQPDLVIWPETAIPFDFLKDPVLKEKLFKAIRLYQVPFLIGSVIEDDEHTYNAAVLINSDGQIAQIYHKKHLIPLTEYIPDTVFWKIFAKVFNVQSADFVPGRASGLLDVSKAKIGLAICSEDNISSLFQHYKKDGAEFGIVLLNNGWFEQKAGLVMHGQHSVMRAVENNLPIVRVSNNGWSCMLDRFGRVKQGSFNDLQQKRFFYYEIPLSNQPSLYNGYGKSFPIVCLIFVLGFLLKRKRT